MNANGTQLRDPINLGLIPWRMAVQINKWTPSRKSGGILSKYHNIYIQPEYRDEHADAGRDCQTRLTRPNSQARTGTTAKCSFSLFSLPRAGLATLLG